MQTEKLSFLLTYRRIWLRLEVFFFFKSNKSQADNEKLWKKRISFEKFTAAESYSMSII